MSINKELEKYLDEHYFGSILHKNFKKAAIDWMTQQKKDPSGLKYLKRLLELKQDYYVAQQSARAYKESVLLNFINDKCVLKEEGEVATETDTQMLDRITKELVFQLRGREVTDPQDGDCQIANYHLTEAMNINKQN